MKSVICKPHELPPKLAFAILQFSMFGHVWHIFVTLAPTPGGRSSSALFFRALPGDLK